MEDKTLSRGKIIFYYATYQDLSDPKTFKDLKTLQTDFQETLLRHPYESIRIKIHDPNGKLSKGHMENLEKICERHNHDTMLIPSVKNK